MLFLGWMDKSADTFKISIRSCLQYRAFPFLLIDNVAVEADRFSVKNVTVNEPVFQGYTGDYMIMRVISL